ncbi:MAG: heavy metal translocating P-type ATPase, partial [Candidatus Gracilibacteria bacterium]|nr:heavy metal translocating P-type ATPase [Candidatus Gracilibacteria bacterium]
MYSLIAIGTTAAYFFSLYNIINYYIIHGNIIPEIGKINSIYFEVSVLLITFVVFGKYLETKTKSKTSNAVKKLMSITPNIVNIFTLKGIIQKDIQDVKIGDIFIVKAGEKIPCDGEIISGEALVDESMLNGEFSLVNKKVKDEVFAGSLNNFSNFKAVIRKTPNNFLINQIITILKDVSFKKTDIENLSDTISKYFVPIVIIISIITFISWYFIGGVGFEKSLIFATSVLVIACPCALGLATPTAIMVGTGVGANSGILIKNPNSLQKAGSINAIVFDKTGTLTTGKLEVSDLIQTNNQNYQDLVNIIYSIESESNHPISKAIIKYCKKFDAKMLKVSCFELENGKGISAKIGNDEYKIGNKNYINLDKDSLKKYSEFENQAKTTIAISKNNKIIGIIALGDQIKDESYNAIKILHKNNIETYIVSGDNQKTTNIVGKTLNFKKQNLLGEILPHQKFEFVKKLQSQGKKVAFVGDGINDSVALSGSDLGISMSSGSDIAMESGDIVLIKNDIRDVWEYIKISKLTIGKI